MEGLAGLHHLHRVRSLPVAVPGVEHRQAAVRSWSSRSCGRHAKAPYLLAGGKKDVTGEEVGLTGDNPYAGIDVLALAEAERPLVGTGDENGVIDPDVLWSCTTCGACVEQCPVDIEHVDHIVDMRRYQVMIESNFERVERDVQNLEGKGNPWGQNAHDRLAWTEDLDPRCRSTASWATPVPVLGRLRQHTEDRQETTRA